MDFLLQPSGAADTGAWDGHTALYYQAREWANGSQGFVRYWGDHAKVPWLFNRSLGIMWTYEDSQSITIKANYIIKQNGYGGFIIWEITGDYPNIANGQKGYELTQLIFNLFGGSSPTSTPSNAWQPYKSYNTGTLVTYNNVSYLCLQSHTSLPAWPPNVPALWQRM